MRDIDKKLFDYLEDGPGLEAYVDLIEKQGADVNVKDADSVNESPLHFAAWLGNWEYVEVLLKNGANPNAKDNNDYTPLHCATLEEFCYGKESQENYIKTVQLLIAYGADVNAVNDEKETPLHIALYYKSDEKDMTMTRLLVEKGAKVNPEDGNIAEIEAKEKARKAVPVTRIGHYSLTQLAFNSSANISINQHE